MAQPVAQTSFHTGEWAPALNARVDLAKYHSAAALLRNFFVDYRGGASTRPGTKYILQAYKSNTDVRLIPFQASTTVGYVLEFGNEYIRFFSNGSPVLETGFNITAITLAASCVVTAPGHNYSPGQWIYLSGIGGTTQLNGQYVKILSIVGDALRITNLRNVPINSTTFGAFTTGGTTQRVYTLPSPFASADNLRDIKFAQDVNQLILCHPDYEPHVLTLVSATNWTLIPIVIGATVAAPVISSVVTTIGAGSVNYAYIVTAVDSNGQESVASSPGTLSSKLDLRTSPGTNTITWGAVANAVSYNVYKAELAYAAIPSGSLYGFIGNCTGVSFNDSNIAPDYSVTFPIATNPFLGAGLSSISLTASGTYTAVPTVAIGAAPAGGVTATATASLKVTGTPALVASAAGGTGFAPDTAFNVGNGVIIIIATQDSGTGEILTFHPITYPGCNPGAITTGSTPANPITITSLSNGATATLDLTWGVGVVTLVSPGSGYTSAPTVTFNPAGATATTAINPVSNGYPTLPGFFQQRLVLANLTQAQQDFFMSVPGAPYNFNTSNITQPNDSISGTLSSGQLNAIQSMVPTPSGLLFFTDRAAWLLNGGSTGSGISPINVVANAQAFNGANNVPPIVANFDILYVQAKGSIIRNTSYNLLSNVFTGTDISVLSSHLFYGYTILEWAWAEEPFKLVWAVRDDGTMLTLTFLKEQELIGWTHSDTNNGLFKSVTSITESTADAGTVDAVYTVVERTINTVTVKYIERVAERIFPNGVEDAWCVDAGLQYDSTPATSFQGGEHLAGETCTGLADGTIIPAFTMANNGQFTLATAASKVTVGKAFTCQLQTLAIDTGNPTIQTKMKQIPAVTVRVADTLGLEIGSSFTTLVAMKDLVEGNVGSMTNTVVTDLVTGDARTFLDASYTVPGQYCIEQSNPFPASVLGVFPQLSVGDTGRKAE